MSSPLEVTGDDIARLDDASLRELIGLLCEAEFRKAGRSAAGVTWGGDQNAPDGGFDVVVEAEEPYFFHGFLKGPKSAFQVKKSRMRRADVLREMKPKGNLRESIRNLIRRTGSYIIVCSAASTSDSSLQARRAAMRDAINDETGHEQLHVDFLDGGRVATWVREHPSYILWVRSRVGRHLQGWQPFANWSNAPGGIDEEYLVDDSVRFYDGTHGKNSDGGLSAETALRAVRTHLSSPGASVRLTGLSGLGKTRFAMALFDARIGDNALNPALAFYTDMSDAPDPDPQRFAQRVIADRTRCVLIIDNCPADLHRRLTRVCAALESMVSLMTIEYDVREDLPPETNVLRLEPAGEDLIAKLIEKRFPHLSQPDAGRIAHLSGGNARLAIALASTVRKGETLSGFQDDDLFRRLFEQRHEPSEMLLSSAEACSLVYSFNGEDTISTGSELGFLSSLVGKSATELHRDVAELRTRNLVQKRGIWRAVLPHALANRLASRALQRIPRDRISTAFLESGSERLLKSFTRRLGFLHDCEEALAISDEWLEEGGWLGDVRALNDFGIEVFHNIAPLSPERTLLAIERAAHADREGRFWSRENPHRDLFVRLLRSLAYDATLFHRSTRLLYQFALHDALQQQYSPSCDILASLFQLYLSGTHASAEERIGLLEELIVPESERHQELAVTCLGSALEAWHFSSHYEFAFGARQRDFGYHPQARADVVRWYGTFVSYCAKLATSNKPVAEKARILLATRFRGLWANAGMLDELEDAASRLQEVCSWTPGWIAVRETLNFDAERLDADSLSRLRRLQDLLRPSTLVDRARTYAFGQPGGSLLWIEEDDSEDGSPRARVEDIVLQIASAAARDEAALSILLPEVVSANGQYLRIFGRGLAEASSDKPARWRRLLRAYEQVPDPTKRNPSALIGFLEASKPTDVAFWDATLDQLMCHPLLATMFPWFQVAAGIDRRALVRLSEAVNAGLVPVEQFGCLALGRQHEAIGDDDLAKLLERIASRAGGIPVAISILSMRFYLPSDRSRAANSRLLIECGRRLLTTYNYSGNENHLTTRCDHELARVAEICLADQLGQDMAERVCKQIISGADQMSFQNNYSQLLKTLARLQPCAFLDAFVGGDLAPAGGKWSRRYGFDPEDNPLNQISDEAIIAWCSGAAAVRYRKVAAVVFPLVRSSDTKELGFKPLILYLLEHTHEVGAILENISRTLMPVYWSGSRADLLEQRAGALQELFGHVRGEVSSWARHMYTAMQEEIWHERRYEESKTRERDERFE
jgi:hypothetical protein